MIPHKPFLVGPALPTLLHLGSNATTDGKAEEKPPLLFVTVGLGFLENELRQGDACHLLVQPGSPHPPAGTRFDHG